MQETQEIASDFEDWVVMGLVLAAAFGAMFAWLLFSLHRKNMKDGAPAAKIDMVARKPERRYFIVFTSKVSIIAAHLSQKCENFSKQQCEEFLLTLFFCKVVLARPDMKGRAHELAQAMLEFYAKAKGYKEDVLGGLISRSEKCLENDGDGIEELYFGEDFRKSTPKEFLEYLDSALKKEIPPILAELKSAVK